MATENIFDQFDVDRSKQTVQRKTPTAFDQFDIPEEDRGFFDEYGYNPQKWMAHMMLNAPESALNLAKDFYSAVRHPIKTGRALKDLGQGVANKLARKAVEMQHGQEIEPMPEYSEVAADVAGEALSGRYGGLENTLRTLVEDPVGAWSDVAGGAGIISKTASRLDPMSLTTKALDKGVTKIAESVYGDEIGIPRSLDPQRREDLIETGMDERIYGSRKGLDNLEAAQRQATEVVNDVIDNIGANDTFDINILNSRLDDLMRGYEGKAGGAEKIAQVQKMKRKLYDDFTVRDGQGNPMTDFDGNPIIRQNISARELQDFKTDIYPRVYRREVDPVDAIRREGAETKGMKQQARSARTELERTYPELIDPNIDWGKHAQLRPMVERAMEQFAEFDPEFLSYIRKKLRNPAWRTRMAVAARKAADGDIAWLEKNLPSPDIRMAIVMSGRNLQEMEEGIERRPLEIDIRQGVPQ